MPRRLPVATVVTVTVVVAVAVAVARSTRHDTNAATNIAGVIVIIGVATIVAVAVAGGRATTSNGTICTARPDTDFHDIDPTGAPVDLAYANLQATSRVGTGTAVQSRPQCRLFVGMLLHHHQLIAHVTGSGIVALGLVVLKVVITDLD